MNAPLVLPAELTIYTVGELREPWAAWLAAADAEDAAARADGSAVAEVDGAGLQLLLSLAASCTAAERPLQLTAPSATLEAACRAFGMAQWLERNA